MTFEILYNCVADAVIDWEDPFSDPLCLPRKETQIYMGDGIWFDRILPFPITWKPQ